MPIRVACSSCSAQYNAPDHLLGKELQCPNCQAAIKVVAPDTPVSSAVTGPPAAEPPKQNGEAKKPVKPTEPEVAAVRANDDDDYYDVGDDPVDLGKKHEREEGEMDMTPMVDVTFLLLIFFMVTASFTLQRSLLVPTPKPSDAPSTQVAEPEKEDQNDTVTVLIDENNVYTVIYADWERESPSTPELFLNLRTARQGDANGNVPTKLLVRANSECLHAKVVTALDAGSAVGMEEVQLMTVEEDG